jgi:hypothetical protein
MRREGDIRAVSPRIGNFYNKWLQAVSFILRPFYLPVATGNKTG